MIAKSLPVVILTGCGSGLGLEMASQLYSRKDFRVVATTRANSLSKLKMQFPESNIFWIRELDVTDDENIYRLINEVCCKWGRIDVLVNNAAVCFRGVVEHMDSESELLQLKTNYLGPMTLARAVLPIMREQRSGQILNISSVSGMLAMPTMASYSASKHALEGASEALWYEARPFGIRVTLVELGFVHSNSYQKVILSQKAQVSSRLSGPHSEYYQSMIPFIERLMKLSFSSPQSIAKRIIRQFGRSSPPLRLSLTPDVFLFSFLKRCLPTELFHRFLYGVLPGSLKWGGAWRAGINSRHVS